eukprot:jgi/Chlat1/1343/Chrsp119S01757
MVVFSQTLTNGNRNRQCANMKPRQLAQLLEERYGNVNVSANSTSEPTELRAELPDGLSLTVTFDKVMDMCRLAIPLCSFPDGPGAVPSRLYARLLEASYHPTMDTKESHLTLVLDQLERAAGSTGTSYSASAETTFTGGRKTAQELVAALPPSPPPNSIDDYWVGAEDIGISNEGLLGPDTSTNTDPSVYFYCPLSGKLLTNAVVTPTGRSYDYEALKAHLEVTSIDPENGMPLLLEDLVPNRACQDAIITYRKMHELADDNPSAVVVRPVIDDVRPVDSLESDGVSPRKAISMSSADRQMLADAIAELNLSVHGAVTSAGSSGRTEQN